MEKLNPMNPICLFFFFLKQLEEGFFCFPSRGLVTNNSSTSPDGKNPDLVKPVPVAAIMVYAAGPSIQVETGIFSFYVVM